MNSLAYIPASDGAANASLMTITNVRSSGATTIQVNTVANVPAKFYGSYGEPHTFTDPVTGETITVISEATAVDFAGHVDGTNVEIDAIAPGYTDNGNQVGDIIVIRPVTEWANNIFNVLSESHEDDGSLKDDIVTPVKRAGGFHIGIIPAATLGTTGNKAITGVGFTPKLVRFAIVQSPSSTVSQTGIGAMTPTDQFISSTIWVGGSAGRLGATDGCIGWMSSTSGFGLKCSYVSMDADGFTINVDNANTAFSVAYEAYA